MRFSKSRSALAQRGGLRLADGNIRAGVKVPSAEQNRASAAVIHDGDALPGAPFR